MSSLITYLIQANKPRKKAAQELGLLSYAPGGIGTAAQVSKDMLEQGLTTGLLSNVANVGTPMLVQGLLGKAAGGMTRQIFAGEKAKTADKKKLALAQQMDAAGAPRKDIWNQTGWFKGVDGRWRWEISDDAAQINPKPIRDISTAVPIMNKETVDQEDLRTLGRLKDKWKAPEFMKHEGAFKSYPEMYKHLSVESDKSIAGKGAYSPGIISFNPPDKWDYPKMEVDPKPIKSTVLHELQHDVQMREGFARGGSPDQFYINSTKFTGADSAKLRALSAAQSIAELQKTNPGEADALLSLYDKPVQLGIKDILKTWKPQQIQEEVSRLTSLQKEAALGRNPYEAYRRLAGETEARTVQKRMNMTPAERALRPPWLDYDVPEQQQIVRGLLGM